MRATKRLLWILIGVVSISVIAGLVGINNAAGFQRASKFDAACFATKVSGHFAIMASGGISVAKSRESPISISVVIICDAPYINILSARTNLTNGDVGFFAPLSHLCPRLNDSIYVFLSTETANSAVRPSTIAIYT